MTLPRKVCRPKKMSLTWHPDNPTQLVVTCDDSRYPYLNIWDLRKASSPVSVLSGFHSAGIIDVSWSSHDTSLLLAASMDGKIVCWNTKTVSVPFYLT